MDLFNGKSNLNFSDTMLRIAITGPESSGKSTLAELLSQEYEAVLVPEYAREFLLERNGVYSQKDLDTIAVEQQKKWSEVKASTMLVCDTEMLVMKIWSKFKYHSVSESILEAYNRQQFDYYFLCRPDIPWEEDPLREHPEEREQLFEIYLKELQNAKHPFTIIQGGLDERLSTCKKIISQFFDNHTGLI